MRWMRFAVALLVLALLAAPVAGQAQINLRIYWWGNQERHDRTLKALDAYKAKNPNISFTPEFIAFTPYWDKLAVQVASGAAPDIIQMDYAYLLDYAQRGALADLTSMERTLTQNRMDPALLNSGKVDGKLQAVCIGLNVAVYTVNTALLNQAGLPVPPDTWTWNDFLTYSKTVKEKLGPNVWFSGDFAHEVNFFEHWLRQQGLPGIYRGNRFAITEKQLTDWWTLWKGYQGQGLTPPAPLTVATRDDLQTFLILKRQAAAHRSWSNEFERFATVMKDPLAMVPLPRGGSQEGAYARCSMFFSVSARSRYAAESAKFITWFIQDPQALDILRTNRGTPVFPRARDVLKRGGLNDFDKNVFGVEERILAFAGKVPPPPSPKGGSQIRDLFTRTTEEVQFGRKTPGKAARDFIAQAVNILEAAAK